MSVATTESFKVWAADNTAYGPVDAGRLVEWIQDERVFPDTFLQPQSDGRWRRAALVATLREHFPSAPPPPEAGAADALRELAVFSGLTDQGFQQLAGLGEFYDTSPPKLVVTKGDPCDAVYFILSGELRVRLVVGVVDKADRTLCKLGAGEFFGELGMFLQSKRTADVLAETDSHLFKMSINAFQLIVRQIPELASPILFNIGVTMARRIAEDNQRFYREVTSQFLWA